MKSIKFTIANKIIGGFMSVLFLFTVFSWIAIVQINKVDRSYSNLLERRSSVIENVQILKSEATEQENALRGLLLTGKHTYKDEYQTSQEIFYKALDEFAATAPNEAAKKQIQELTAAYEEYHSISKNIMQLNDNSREEALHAFNMGDVNTAGSHFHKLADGVIHVANQVMAADQEKAAETTKLINKMLIITTIVTIILGVGISLLISSFISKPVKHVSAAMKQLASGDFSIESIKVRNKDEIGELVDAMNSMVEDLRNIIKNVSESSTYLAASMEELSVSSNQSTAVAEQVANISQKNTSGAENQLQMFTQTAAKIQEVAAEVDLINHSSDDMLKAMVHTTDMTKKGSLLMDDVVEQMEQIHTSTENSSKIIRSLGEHSQNINGIISLISDVSDQTSLLALNAAIEAARAGEQGKGFAVVAEEVRKLADEARQSTEKVTEMIAIIQQGTKEAIQSIETEGLQVTKGLSSTNEAKLAFSEIQTSISNATKQVKEVSTSIQEIEDLNQQIVNGIEQVKVLSEQALHLSQESSAASEEQLATTEEIDSLTQNIEKLAAELQNLISRFKS